MEEVSFGIYIPSYRRAELCCTHKKIEYGTYVVRKSEEAAYRARDLSPCTVLAVDDDKIGGLVEVNQWLIDNAPEDVICILDDDIQHFYYRLDTSDEIESPETITMELERFAQLMVDLGVGFGSVDASAAIWNYNGAVDFKGTTGSTRWVNRPVFKAKCDKTVEHNYDLDVVLQELLYNRIILKPRYLCSKGSTDTLAGGASQKLRDDQILCINMMKQKWGKYFKYNLKNNKPNINVER